MVSRGGEFLLRPEPVDNNFRLNSGSDGATVCGGLRPHSGAAALEPWSAGARASETAVVSLMNPEDGGGLGNA